ncbi:MAG: maleylpyruvate isomerase N-terminal domain-containing protein [Actinomycetota bacterium]
MTDDREEHAAREAEGWAAFLATLDRIPRERWEEPGVLPGWSVKDMLWHVAGWLEICVETLDAMRDGRFEEQDWSDERTNARNAELAEQARGMDDDAVWSGLLDARRRVLRRWAELPQIDERAIEDFSGETHDHYEEHLADLERFAG